MQTKHLWIIVKSIGGKNNGHNLLRFSMVVDGIKESRTRMGSTGSLLLFQQGLPEGGQRLQILVT